MNEKLKKLLQEIKNNTQIGYPSHHYPINNNKATSVYSVPFEKKPLVSLLKQLGIHAEAEGLRSQGDLHSLQKSELIIPSISDDSHTATLSLEQCKHLLNTSKIYLNTDTGLNEEQYKSLLPKTFSNVNKILDFAGELKYQSHSICHAQEISFLVSFQACKTKKNKAYQSKEKLTSRLIGLPQAGTVVSNNLWLLSTTEFEFPKNKEIDPEKYLLSMFHNLFHAAIQEHCEYLIIPTLDFGHHKADNELFNITLIHAAKLYPNLNIIYSPAHQHKELKKRLNEEQCENIGITKKDVLAIASFLQQKKLNTALYNPTTLEAVYGYADIGCYWQYSSRFGKSFSAILGNISTCILNSHGINPEAFNRINTFSLVSKPEALEHKDSTDSDGFATASETSEPEEDKMDVIEPPAQEVIEEKHEALEEKHGSEPSSSSELPPEPELPLEPVVPTESESLHDHSGSPQQEETIPAAPLPASIPPSPISPRDGFFPPETKESSSATTDLVEWLSDEQKTQIQLQINKLEREYNSCWPDFYKSRKLDKAKALTQLMKDANYMSLTDALQKARSNPSVTAGFFSRRTKNLLDEIEEGMIFRQKI